MSEIPVGSDQKVNGNPNATSLSSEKGFIFDRDDFLINKFKTVGGTNKEITPDGKEGTGYIDTEVLISDETQTSYTNFMRNHFHKILQMKQSGEVAMDEQGNPIKYNALFGKNGSHAHEAAILDQIVSDDGTKIDTTKLSKFLQTSRGMMITTQLIEEVNAEVLFALGLEAVKEPQAGRNNITGELHVKLGIDQGKLNQLADRFHISHEKLIELSTLPTGAAVTSTLASLFSNGEPIGGVPASVVGALGGVLGIVGLKGVDSARRSLMKEGITFDLERSITGLQQLQNNPQEAAYIKAMTGIDVNVYRVNNNTIELKPISERVSESNRDPDEVRAEVLQGIYARSHFLDDLGIDIHKRDGTPEQRFLKGKNGADPKLQGEQLGLQWERMIEEEFKPNQGGIQDKSQRKPGDAGFNPNDLDTEGNIQRYMEARKRVMTKMVDTLVQDEQKKIAKEAEEAEEKTFSQNMKDASAVIDRKLESLQSGGETQEQREAALDGEKAKLEDRKKEVDEKLEAFKGSGVNREKLDEIQDTLTDEYGLVVAQNETTDQVIDRRIEELFEELQGTQQDRTNSLTYRLSDLRTTYSNETVAEINRLFNGLPPNMQRNINALNEVVANAKESVKIRYGTQIAQLEQEITSAQEKINGLREQKQKYKEAQKGIQEAVKAQTEQAQVNIDEMQQEVAKLTPQGSAISENDLLTLSMEELVDRAEGMTDTAGNPLYENRDKALQGVLQAKAEAQLRSDEIADGLYNAEQLRAYYEITSKGITDLDSKNAQDILDEAYQNWGWDQTQDAQNRAFVEDAIQYATTKKNTPEMKTGRYRASLELESKYIEDRLKTLEKKREEVKTGVSTEAERLKAYKAAIPNIEDMSDRQGDIMSNVDEAFMQKLNDYASTEVVQPGDKRYTPAEQAAGYPEGYYKTLDLIFKYQKLPNGDQVFTHLKEVLPPDKLADMFQKHLVKESGKSGPTIQSGQQLTLPDMYGYLKKYHKNFSPTDYRRAFRSIINQLREEALALARQ